MNIYGELFIRAVDARHANALLWKTCLFLFKICLKTYRKFIELKTLSQRFKDFKAQNLTFILKHTDTDSSFAGPS